MAATLLGAAIAPAPAEARRGTSRPTVARAAQTRGQIALRYARAQLGKPYRSGADGPDAYDCSGLTQQAWRSAGVPIPRTAQQQARFGAAVPLRGIQPGDLVIFYANASHVGIYAGKGIAVVAPRPGAVVRLEPIRSMPVHGVRRP